MKHNKRNEQKIKKQLDGQVHSPLPPTHSARGKTKASKRQLTSVDELAAKRASSKLQDGDVRGAVRCLTSSETVAPFTNDTIDALKSKHPSCPRDRRPPPSLTSRALVVSEDDIRGAIWSF